MYKNRKPIIIGVLCVLVVVMAIGFALLREQLTITGSSHIDSNWNIRITSITANATGSAEDKEASGDCTTRTSGSCNSTSATFNAGLNTPGDTVTYTVTVTNSGSLDGVVSGITLTPQTSSNDPIQVTKSGLEQGDKITANGGTNTIQVIVTYNPATESQPSNTNSEVTLTINYQQDLGQVSPPAPTYKAYSVGDVVKYKGSNWRVIKNSTASDDYVTLMKETALTGSEIGANYVWGGDTSNSYMAYYWSSTCHYSGTYGTDTYDSGDDSGCSGHNDYAGSKIKEVVDNYMSNYLDASDLKEIDGYKIRLIKLDELQNNLGLSSTFNVSWYDFDSSNTPNWVYQNLGTNVYGYWTMSPNVDNAAQAWNVQSGAQVYSGDVLYSGINGGGVRPVINLLKSNIPSQQ